MNKETFISIFVVPVVIIVALLFVAAKNSGGTTNTATSVLNEKKRENSGQSTDTVVSSTQPAMIIDKTKKYTAVLNTTEGEITIDLYTDKTPITVNNFVSLSKENFYNNTIFHRVINGFMIQGGDPKGNGTGGPGYKFDDEKFEGEYTAGTIAMANAGPNTNGSQFFIMHKDYPLPKNYVIFGKVSKGLDIVDKIATAPVEMSQMGEKSKPVNPVSIKSVTIVEK